MLISCPKCGKAYRVDPNELPTAQKSKQKGEGWFLSCQHCFHEWWFKATKGFTWYDGGLPPEHFGKTVARTPSHFEDKTDLSALKRNRPHQSEEETTYHSKIMSQEYSPFNEGFIYDADLSKKAKKLSEKAKSSFFVRTVISILIGVVGLSLAYAFGLFYLEDTAKIVSSPLKVPDEQKLFLGLRIENKTFASDKLGLTVKGQVVNPSDKSRVLKNLKLSAWFACEKDSIAKNIVDGEPYCLAKSWIHSLEGKVIQPKEKISFETKAPIPCTVRILKVDAEFID